MKLFGLQSIFCHFFILSELALISGIYGAVVTTQNGGDKGQYIATRGS